MFRIDAPQVVARDLSFSKQILNHQNFNKLIENSENKTWRKNCINFKQRNQIIFKKLGLLTTAIQTIV